MAESKVDTALLEEVRERLQVFLAEGGHRKTPERFAVLEEIYTAGGHFDVDTLLERMKRRGAKVGKLQHAARRRGTARRSVRRTCTRRARNRPRESRRIRAR